MTDALNSHASCSTCQPAPMQPRERGVLAVVGLTAAMMVIEIGVGQVTGSMALLADGWHMATHVGALGLASAAYAIARRFAAHRAFAFGTGKVGALAGFTSAVALSLVALVMMADSVGRLIEPRPIDFASSLPVAVLGLIVNVVSVVLLNHSSEHDHRHDHHGHDHNHRAAMMHIVSDLLTSALAIVALLAGRLLGWLWLDAAIGLLGGVVILKWGVGLCESAALELLDVEASPALEDQIRQTLESVDDVRVRDLHVWPIGRGARSCVVTVLSAAPREPQDYKAHLAPLKLAHLTIEVQRCMLPGRVDA